MNIQKHKEVIVDVHGVQVVCLDVEFYPYVPATATEPAVDPFVDFGEILISDQEASKLFYDKQLDVLEAAVIKELTWKRK